MKEKELKKKLLIAFSSYKTGGDWTLDEWFEVQDMKRNDADFKKRYEALKIRK